MAVADCGARRFCVHRTSGYSGGLSDGAYPRRSPDLRNGYEVDRVQRDSGVDTVEFRPSMAVGAGSLSFQLMKSLTDRLSITLCPRWLTTPTRPAAVDDVLAYLLAAKDLHPADSRAFEIGGPNVVSYGNVIRAYSRPQGLRRWQVSVPVLRPYLSGPWHAPLSPTAFEVGRHLMEGLKNPTVGRDTMAVDVFPIRPVGLREAVRRAMAVGPRSAGRSSDSPGARGVWNDKERQPNSERTGHAVSRPAQEFAER